MKREVRIDGITAAQLELARFSHTTPTDNVAHALVRAVSRLVSTPEGGGTLSSAGVAKSGDAARTSAYATSSAWLDEGNYTYSRTEGASIGGTFHVTPVGPGGYLVQLGTRSYRVCLGPSGEVSVNGKTVRMQVLDPRALQTGGHGRAGTGRATISASMPGKVVRVLVAPEDQVEAGQGLIVVEAMKMQNEMKAPRAGRVVEVRTTADATVAAGDILVVID